MRTGLLKTTGLLLVAAQILPTAAEAEQAVPTIPEIRAVFEQELFDLAHTVFLANGNLPEALGVAEKAVKARPHDLVWRRKAARTAVWAGRSDLALDHWYFLALRGDQEAYGEALTLSRALQEFPLRKHLLGQAVTRGTADQAMEQEYLAVAEGMGLPQEVYDLLRSSRLGRNDSIWRLTEQARLAEHLGMPEEAIQAWQQRAILQPLTSDEALKLAALWYGQGDTEQAWQALDTTAAQATADAVPFWRTYADLSWAQGHAEQAARAAAIMIRSGSALEADYLRLLELYRNDAPERAYGYALQGWQRFLKPQFWYALVDTGLRSGREQELIHFLQGLDAQQRKVLAADPRSWMAVSQVYRQAGQLQQALTAARVAVRLAPDAADLLSSYLWLLVDLKQSAELQPLVRQWEGRLALLPELREPLAAALMLAGDTPRALRHYRVLAPQRQDDPAWLASFGDVLEQAGHQEAAWEIRRRAYRLLQQTAADANLDERRRQLTRAQLLLHLRRGDELSGVVCHIAANLKKDFGTELVMGWAMATGQTDLARLWYWRHLARAVQRPEWARLGLALEENDRTTMADLLDGKLEQLPYRDAVEAARRTGWTALAEEHSFNRLQLNRDDHLLDTQVRQLYGSRPGFIQTSLQARDQAGVGWFASRLTLSQPLTSRYSLLAELTERQFSLLRSNVLGSIPRTDLGGTLAVTRRHEGGQLVMELGVRDGGTAVQPTAAVAGSWRLWHDLQLSGRFAYHERAEETAALAVGGARDRLQLLVAGSLTASDTVALELSSVRLYDQDRQYLGQGQAVSLELRHQITRAWPDYGLRLFGGYSIYRADGSVSSRTAALVPVGTLPTAAFFVPKSYGSLGAGIFLGETWKGTYTRDWKPFAAADVSWNSSSGTGFSYSLGMVGPVFGLDQLLLELTQGSGQFGMNDLSTTIGIRYRYFY